MSSESFQAYVYQDTKTHDFVISFDTRFYGLPRIGELIRVKGGSYRITDIQWVIGDGYGGQPAGLIDFFVKKEDL